MKQEYEVEDLVSCRLGWKANKKKVDKQPEGYVKRFK